MICPLAFNLLERFYVGNIPALFQLIESSNSTKLSAEYLQRICEFASQHTLYYPRYFRSPPQLSDLPLLTKPLIRQYSFDLTSDRPRKRTFPNSSGGSTGQPVSLIQDQEYNSWSKAAETYYFHHFLDVDYPSVPKVVLWGSDRDALRMHNLHGRFYNWISGTVFLNTFNADDLTWKEYVSIINRTQPVFIKGYAGSLYQIAKIIRKNNLTVFRPKFLYSSAECLQDFMRREIQEVFQAKVYDFYGSREVGAIAGECHLSHKHIFSWNNYVEIFHLQSDRLAPTGANGRVIISNLHNYSQPLLRYEIGDVGSLATRKCNCGSDLPWFSHLKGRVTDYFIKQDKTLVHGEFFTHLFYFRQWVGQFRVTQQDFKKLLIEVVKSDKPDPADIQEITTKIKFMMGQDCRITWKYVSHIDSSNQGKFLFTRSLISPK